jgi:hypothetical protein
MTKRRGPQEEERASDNTIDEETNGYNMPRESENTVVLIRAEGFN